MNSSGHLVKKSTKPFRQIFPKPGWVEHNSEDIWQSVLQAIEGVTKDFDHNQISAIGISNQRETVFVWDRLTGQPIYNGIVWQCRRSRLFCEKLLQNNTIVKAIKEKTGLTIDPYFSASKVHWILQNIDGALKKAQSGDLALGTVDTFLLWHLTDGKVHATDVSNASRTQLMNIQDGHWDSELLDIFSIPDNLLPEIHPSGHNFGFTKGLKVLPRWYSYHCDDRRSAGSIIRAWLF